MGTRVFFKNRRATQNPGIAGNDVFKMPALFVYQNSCVCSPYRIQN